MLDIQSCYCFQYLWRIELPPSGPLSHLRFLPQQDGNPGGGRGHMHLSSSIICCKLCNIYSISRDMWSRLDKSHILKIVVYNYELINTVYSKYSYNLRWPSKSIGNRISRNSEAMLNILRAKFIIFHYPIVNLYSVFCWLSNFVIYEFPKKKDKKINVFLSLSVCCPYLAILKFLKKIMMLF